MHDYDDHDDRDLDEDEDPTCDFCGDESEDGCHQCDVNWCSSCRFEHDCPHESGDDDDDLDSDDDDHDDEDEEDEETGETCYGCHHSTATTMFMEQHFCWPCYQAVSSGSHAPDRLSFADPGGTSALRAAGPGNPRVYSCPNCQSPNRLTSQDVARGYQCDSCADQAERGW